MTAGKAISKHVRYWLVVGHSENWRTAFEHGNIWGLKQTQRHPWENLRENDNLLFYATKPVGGVIGCGRVRTKFRQDKPLWPQELQEGQVIWPLRFEFDVDCCVSPDKWREEKLVSKDLLPRGGFQLLTQNVGEKLALSLKRPNYVVPAVKVSLTAEVPTEHESTSDEQREAPPSHDDVKQALVEIGRLQQFIAESEYQFDIGRLDVVWRRVQLSVPTYVFEVQIGGNLHQAMSKLKHAFDLWNSHVFLVSSHEDLIKARQLRSGTFHEIRDRLKFVDHLRVRELLLRKQSYHDLEKELGIL